jgi:hypothetical protein
MSSWVIVRILAYIPNFGLVTTSLTEGGYIFNLFLKFSGAPIKARISVIFGYFVNLLIADYIIGNKV